MLEMVDNFCGHCQLASFSHFEHRILSIASVYGAYLENCTVHRGDIKAHFSQIIDSESGSFLPRNLCPACNMKVCDEQRDWNLAC